MRTVIIGPGRVGTLLAVACSRSGHRVTDVAGGTPGARERLGSLVAGIRPHDHVAEAVRDAQLLLLAVPDDRLAEVVMELVVADVVRPGLKVVHLAGSRGPDVLDLAARAGASVAACHPAMTIPSGSVDPEVLVGVPWAVTASAGDRLWAHEFVRDLGGDPHDVAADRRALYHAALAVGANAVATAVATARQLLLAAAVDDPAAFLVPLAHASVDAVAERGAAAITGPVVRGDLSTVARHLDAIAADVPGLATSYRRLASATLALVRAGLDPRTVDQLTALLTDDAIADLAAGATAERADDAEG